MVRARFLSSASGQLSKKAIFLLEKLPRGIASGVPTESAGGMFGPSGGTIGGGSDKENISIEEEVKE